MSKTKRAVIATATGALVAGGLLATPSVGNATVAGFRMSNFGAYIAEVCVQTDVQRQCTGWLAAGKSEVWNVNYNDAKSFKCDFEIKGDSTYRMTTKFSRDEFKECKAEGALLFSSPKFYLVRPNGSTQQIEVS